MQTKVAVSIDDRLIREVDLLVRDERYASSSQAIEAAVAEQLRRVRRRRLAEACAVLDPVEEVALAEEGLGADARAWPPY
ncbi:MAG: ribbon-helix-helix domain-containing protein [Trueperaceae bacterium]|nr:ribbon-helix-helix domain-containing protein [Trueperaceae bacterium]